MEENNLIRQDIGLKISQLILKKKLTKTYIVDKMGIARPTLDDWIKGNVAISAESLYALSCILETTVSYFFDEKEKDSIRKTTKPKTFLAFELDESQEEKVIKMVMGKEFIKLISI
jgi:transcriptional regulator with XRE-family HTH domain